MSISLTLTWASQKDSFEGKSTVCDHSLCSADGGSTAEPQHSHQARFKAPYPTHEFHHGPWSDHWHLPFEARKLRPQAQLSCFGGCWAHKFLFFWLKARFWSNIGKLTCDPGCQHQTKPLFFGKYHPITHRACISGIFWSNSTWSIDTRRINMLVSPGEKTSTGRRDPIPKLSSCTERCQEFVYFYEKCLLVSGSISLQVQVVKAA